MNGVKKLTCIEDQQCVPHVRHMLDIANLDAKDIMIIVSSIKFGVLRLVGDELE